MSCLPFVPYWLTFSAATAPSGPAGGDLTGTYPAPTVTRIQGYYVDPAVPTDGQILVWNTVSAEWKPTDRYAVQSANAFLAGPASGAAAVPTWRAIVIGDLPVASSGVVNSTQLVRADDGRLWTQSGSDVYRGSGNAAVGSTPGSTTRLRLQGLGTTATTASLRAYTGGGTPVLEVTDDNHIKMINGCIVFSSYNPGNNVGQILGAGNGEGLTINTDPATNNGRVRLESKLGAGLQLVTTGGGGVAIGSSAFVSTAQVDIDSSTMRLRQTFTPASTGAVGNAGDICFDDNYIYRYTSAGWKRAALVTF